MKLVCCLCGRSMFQAFVHIGAQPVGEKCARKAGLEKLAKKKTGTVRLATQSKRVREPVPMTRDLFEGE